MSRCPPSRSFSNPFLPLHISPFLYRNSFLSTFGSKRNHHRAKPSKIFDPHPSSAVDTDGYRYFTTVTFEGKYSRAIAIATVISVTEKPGGLADAQWGRNLKTRDYTIVFNNRVYTKRGGRAGGREGMTLKQEQPKARDKKRKRKIGLERVSRRTAAILF